MNKLPSPAEALKALRILLSMAVYTDIDASTEDGATTLLARWAVAELALDSLSKAIGDRAK